MKKTRVRFAPSPTGYLHVGGARTALFNLLFAKHHGGTSILRIEDTDLERSTEEAVQAIFQGLDWLELKFDEGPFYQTTRFPLYIEHAKKLLQLGAAYPCTCDEARLASMREQQKEKGQKPQYDRKHRPLNKTPLPPTLPSGNESEPFVIRLRAPTEGTTVFDDLILGEISTPNAELDDLILIRSDGTPTYNFTVVVDDVDMEITHVIRGMDHVSNTPKQIAIYRALGLDPPLFAHVPMILGPDKKKLSKRHGATSVIDYKSAGYLPSAFVNYLARLGWSHGDQEIFTRKELEDFFSLEHVGKSPAVFDQTKLQWVNSEHIKRADISELVNGILFFLERDGFNVQGLVSNKAFLKLIESLRERAKTLDEMAKSCHWYFYEDDSLPMDKKACGTYLNLDFRPTLEFLISKLEDLNDFTEAKLESLFHQIVNEKTIKLGKLAQPVRVALTGSSVSPPIYTVLEALGKVRSVNRLNRALSLIKS